MKTFIQDVITTLVAEMNANWEGVIGCHRPLLYVSVSMRTVQAIGVFCVHCSCFFQKIATHVGELFDYPFNTCSTPLGRKEFYKIEDNS